MLTYESVPYEDEDEREDIRTDPDGWDWGSFFWGLIAGGVIIGPLVWTVTGRSLAKEAGRRVAAVTGARKY